MFTTTREPYPVDFDHRQMIRNVIKANLLEQALADAKTARHSIKCREGDHRRTDPVFGPAGCQNDGTTCLCECHDDQGKD